MCSRLNWCFIQFSFSISGFLKPNADGPLTFKFSIESLKYDFVLSYLVPLKNRKNPKP